MVHRHCNLVVVVLCLLACDAELLRHKNHGKDIIGGNGDWKFRFVPNRALPPTGTNDNVQDGHSLVLDSFSGDFYYFYNQNST